MLKKLFTLLWLVPSILAISTTFVSAQYEGDIITPDYENGAEVYGINTQKNKVLTFYPESCQTIEKVTIKTNKDVNGKIVMKSIEEKPKEAKDDLNKVIEYCNVKLENIKKEDFEVEEVKVRVTKEDLKEKDIDKEEIALYTLKTNGDWNTEKTTQKNDSNVYYYYDAEASNFPYWAVAEDRGFSISDLFSRLPIILLICCIFMLLAFIAAYVVSRRRKQSDDKATN